MTPIDKADLSGASSSLPVYGTLTTGFSKGLFLQPKLRLFHTLSPKSQRRASDADTNTVDEVLVDNVAYIETPKSLLIPYTSPAHRAKSACSSRSSSSQLIRSDGAHLQTP